MPDRIAIGLNIIPNSHPSDEHHDKVRKARRKRDADKRERMQFARKGRNGEDKMRDTRNTPIAQG